MSYRVSVIVLVVMTLLAAGCQGSFRDRKHPRFLTQGDAEFYLNQALENPSADVRRGAISRIAQTPFVFEQSTLEALAAVAKADKSQSVRSAAMQAMGRSTRKIVAMTAIEVLFGPRESDVDAVGPDEAVRESAMLALEGCAARGVVTGKLADVAAGLGVELLGSDSSRNVRLVTAQMLGRFPRTNVLQALVEALVQRDFGVCHEAERSLSRLTGRSFDHDATAWHKFIDNTDDPFADRGRLDDQLDREPRQWWAMDRPAMDWAWFRKDTG